MGGGGHGNASKDVLLHLGHLPAASNTTGRVKRFMYSQSLHFQRIDRRSSASRSCFRAQSARSRIVSKIAFSGFSDLSAIDSIQVAGDVCVACVAVDGYGAASVLGRETGSCSHEHIASGSVVKGVLGCLIIVPSGTEHVTLHNAAAN